VTRTDDLLATRIGATIRVARTAAGYTQKQLAVMTGMDQSALSRLENGVHVPTIVVLDRIAAALGAELEVSLTPPAA